MNLTRWYRGGWARKTPFVPARLSLSNGYRGLWFLLSTVSFTMVKVFFYFNIGCHYKRTKWTKSGSVCISLFFRCESGLIWPPEYSGLPRPTAIHSRSRWSTAGWRSLCLCPTFSYSLHPAASQQEELSERHPQTHDGRDQNQPGMMSLNKELLKDFRTSYSRRAIFLLCWEFTFWWFCSHRAVQVAEEPLISSGEGSSGRVGTLSESKLAVCWYTRSTLVSPCLTGRRLWSLCLIPGIWIFSRRASALD